MNTTNDTNLIIITSPWWPEYLWVAGFSLCLGVICATLNCLVLVAIQSEQRLKEQAGWLCLVYLLIIIIKEWD
jgi:hypothetical protein